MMASSSPCCEEQMSLTIRGAETTKLCFLLGVWVQRRAVKAPLGAQAGGASPRHLGGLRTFKISGLTPGAG